MRTRVKKLLRSLPLVKAGQDGELRLEAVLPGLDGQPFVSLQARLGSEHSDDGETTHLQARIETRFSALSAGPSRSDTTATALPGPNRSRALGVYQRSLGHPLVQRALAPLAHLRLSQWVDVQTTTRPLDRGAGSLLPERLAEVGAVRHRDGPPLQGWVAELPGPTGGLAQVLTLALDKQDLPEPLRDRLGRQPFHLAATLVQTAEEDFS